MIKEKEVIDCTHYGLNIYAHILRKYYPKQWISLSGKQCKPARNPFNKNKRTLNLFNHDWMFRYEDSDLKDFSGNPFDFAQLHYKLSGEDLLQKLNSELNLRIGEKRQSLINKNLEFEAESKEEKQPIIIPFFSFFKRPVTNTQPADEITLGKLYQLIKSDTYKQQTIKLRSIADKDQARMYKAKEFDYVTFSGTFSKRNDAALIIHSGLLTIDFDHISDILSLKKQLLNDRYFETELMFISPSGKGLKWIIPINITRATHQDYFQAVSAYIKHTYKLEVDKSGKDLSRACFLPYDQKVYINPKYLNQ